MRAWILFVWVLIALGAVGTVMMTASDPKGALAAAFDSAWERMPFGGAGAPSGRASPVDGSDPLAAFLATTRALFANDPDALFGHSTPRDALSHPIGGQRDDGPVVTPRGGGSSERIVQIGR